MQRPRPTRAAPSSPSDGQAAASRPAILLIVAALLVVAPLTVEWPFFRLEHVQDDVEHLGHIGDYLSGQDTLFEYLFTPVNEHLLPAWRLWYLISWRLFGLQPQGWHVAVALAQGASAAMLFFVLRAYTGRVVTSAAAAALWAIAGIGGWESPLTWIASSHLVFGVAWIVAAMACLTRYRTSAGWRWPALMAGCLAMAVLNMSAMWALTPALVAQWWLLERQPGASWWPQRRWGMAWFAPFTAFSVVAILGGLQVFEPRPVPIEHHPVTALVRLPSSWSIAAENLAYRDVANLPDKELPRDEIGIAAPRIGGRVLGGLVLLAAVFILPGVNRRLILLFVGVTFVYGFLVHLARSDFSADYMILNGRYTYLPTFGWCGVLGAILAAPWFYASAVRRTALYVVLVVVAPLLVAQQVRTIDQTVARFQSITDKGRIDLRRSIEFLAVLSEEGQRRGKPLKLPNVTLACRPISLSALQLIGIAYPAGLPGIEIVPARKWSAADEQHLRAVLERTSNPVRWTFETALTNFHELSEVMLAFDAQGAASGRAMRFPDFELTLFQPLYAGSGTPRAPTGENDPQWTMFPSRVMLSTLIPRMFPDGLTHVELVEEGRMTKVDWQAAIAALAPLKQDTANSWRQSFESMLKDM